MLLIAGAGPLSIGCLVGRLTFERRFWVAVFVLPVLSALVALMYAFVFLFPCYRRQEIDWDGPQLIKHH